MSSQINLTGEERADLEQATTSYKSSTNRQAFTLDGYMKKWLRIVDEIGKGYPLGVYDYTNDLSCRSILQEFSETLPKGLQEKIGTEIKPIDEEFLSVTQETEIPLMGTKESSSRLPWWLRRIPKKLEGELEEDVRSLTDAY